MTVQKKIKCYPHVINYFKEVPFCNIYSEKLNIKRLEKIDFLPELPFYEELNVIKTKNALKGCAMSYKVESAEEKGSIIQLEASKLSIKDLFNDLLDETKSFKCRINTKILLKKTKALKLTLLLLILIQQQKKWQTIKLILTNLFKKFRTELFGSS